MSVWVGVCTLLDVDFFVHRFTGWVCLVLNQQTFLTTHSTEWIYSFVSTGNRHLRSTWLMCLWEREKKDKSPAVRKNHSSVIYSRKIQWFFTRCMNGTLKMYFPFMRLWTVTKIVPFSATSLCASCVFHHHIIHDSIYLSCHFTQSDPCKYHSKTMNKSFNSFSFLSSLLFMPMIHLISIELMPNVETISFLFFPFPFFL